MARTARRERTTKETSIVIEIDLDGSRAHGGLDRAAVLRPHARSARASRRLRPRREGRGRPPHRQPPHRRGRGDRARRGDQARRSATRQGCGASPAAATRSTRRSSTWRSTSRAARTSCGRCEMPEAIPLGTPPFDPQLAEHAVTSLAMAAGITLHVDARAGPQRAPHHRGDLQGPRPHPARRGAGGGHRRALDEGRPVTASRRAARAAAGRRARLRHRQPPLGPEGAGEGGRRCPPHRRPRPHPRRGGVVLPGVGAFGACMERSATPGSTTIAIEASSRGRPFLGICVGMQMIFRDSEEDPAARGLGSSRAPIRWIPPGVKRPQMQWNRLDSPSRTTRCSPASGRRRGCTSSTRSTACPTTRRSSPRRASTA